MSSAAEADMSVIKLLEEHSESIAALKAAASDTLGAEAIAEEPYSNDVFYLRICLHVPKSTEGDSTIQEKRVKCLQNLLAWRSGNGKTICDAALKAVAAAQADPSVPWKNERVMEMAPHTEIISKYYIPGVGALTTTSRKGDLVYIIRAGAIDDVNMMKNVTIDQMKEFLTYVREVNSLVSLQRSIKLDRMVRLITLNDLKGVGMGGGDANFRKALGEFGKETEHYFPALCGPTLLCNLPFLMQGLIGFFQPFMPQSVQARVKFVRGPLENCPDLLQVASHATGPQREALLNDLDKHIYSS